MSNVFVEPDTTAGQVLWVLAASAALTLLFAPRIAIVQPVRSATHGREAEERDVSRLTRATVA
jgi:hypothetical protein